MKLGKKKTATAPSNAVAAQIKEICMFTRLLYHKPGRLTRGRESNGSAF